MNTQRRSWIKQIGLAMAGIGFGSTQTFAGNLGRNFAGIHEAAPPAGPIILRSNENPYGPSPLAIEAIIKNASLSNRYHWELANQLLDKLSKRNNVTETNILLGAGSTEILDLLAKLASTQTGNYIVADPSYDYWTTTLDKLGLEKVKVAVDANKAIDLDAMAAAIDAKTRLVYICNPNNPTGTLLTREALISFAEKIPKSIIIVVDEAYLEYTKELSLSNSVNRLSNVVVIKTFSKIYGLAGSRIGYAIANPEMIRQLSQMQSNTNNSVSVVSKLAAIASMDDKNFIAECYEKNENARTYTALELEKLNIKYIPSNTNFLYFSLNQYQKDYFEALKAKNILGTGVYEDKGKWTRITIGTIKEMKQFINALTA